MKRRKIEIIEEKIKANQIKITKAQAELKQLEAERKKLFEEKENEETEELKAMLKVNNLSFQQALSLLQKYQQEDQNEV